MAKRLNAEKTAYVERIVNFMHKNHNSMWWSLDETRKKWRRGYQFSKNVLDEIIHESVLFMNLLDAELNYDFRKKMLNFISNYLCVYAARDPEIGNDENRAYAQLFGFFDAWLKTSEERKSESKKQHTQSHKDGKTSAPGAKYTKRVYERDGKIIQKITKNSGETVEIAYDDMRAYRMQRMADLAAVVGPHVK